MRSQDHEHSITAVASGHPIDREELTDIISDALGDSMDVDWNYATGARYVIAALVNEGLLTLIDPELT